MRFIELKPRHLQDEGAGVFHNGQPRSWHEIAFLCPRCRKHEISVAFWGLPPSDKVQVGEAAYGPIVHRMWHRPETSTRGFLDLTLEPSINREGCGDKCGGWHGFITNGEVS